MFSLTLFSPFDFSSSRIPLQNNNKNKKSKERSHYVKSAINKRCVSQFNTKYALFIHTKHSTSCSNLQGARFLLNEGFCHSQNIPRHINFCSMVWGKRIFEAVRDFGFDHFLWMVDLCSAKSRNPWCETQFENRGPRYG